MSGDTKTDDVFSLLPVLLFSLSGKISQHAHQNSARPLGLDMSQWRVIQILGSDQNQSINQVADSIAMDRGGTSRAISRLEHRGMVERKGDPEDRRRSTVSLTSSGQEIYEIIVKFTRWREEKLRACLTSAEIEALGGILIKLDDQINNMQDESHVGPRQAEAGQHKTA